MNETDCQQITERLGKLEKQNRFMKLGGLAVALLVVATLLTGAVNKPEITDEVRAKRIVLVDEQGKDVIVMENLNNNTPRLVILDSKGKIRFDLLATGTGSTLSVNDSKGKRRLVLAISDEGSYLALSNTNEKNLLLLAAEDRGSALNMYDSNNKIQLYLNSANPNGGSMTIYDKTRKEVVILGADRYGSGRVFVCNRKGDVKMLTPDP